VFARCEPFWGLCVERKRSRLPPTHAPHPFRGVATTKSSPFGGDQEGRPAGAMGPGRRVARHGAWRGLRRVVDRRRDGAEQGRHPLSKRFARTGTGQVEEHPSLGLFDLGGDCAAGKDDGRGVRLGQRSLREGGRPSGMLEARGGTRQEESHRVGQEAGGRRAVAVEVSLHGLDRMFAMATGAIEVCVEPLGWGRLQRGHHKAGGIARPQDCGLAHHPPGLPPGLCGRGQRVRQAAAGRRRLALGLGQCDPLLVETTGCWDGGSGWAQQDGMARTAKDTSCPAVGGDPIEDLGGSNRTRAADQHRGVGPVAPQRRQQPDHAHGLCGPGRAGARTQGGRDEGVRGPCKHTEWEVALGPRVLVREGTLLLAMRRSIGGSESEPHGRRGRWRAGKEVSDQGGREPREVLAVPLVCQPRARGRTRQGVLRVHGASLAPECAPGVMAETLGVIGVRISRGHVIHALGQQVPQGMVHRGRMARIVDSGREALGQPDLAVDTPQEEGPKVRRQGPPLEIGTHRIPSDRRKAALLWASIGQKQTSWGLYGMDASHIPCYQRLARGLCFFMKNSG
jgi:hypothetical protein